MLKNPLDSLKEILCHVSGLDLPLVPVIFPFPSPVSGED
jgi:hypothetical protein